MIGITLDLNYYLSPEGEWVDYDRHKRDSESYRFFDLDFIKKLRVELIRNYNCEDDSNVRLSLDATPEVIRFFHIIFETEDWRDMLCFSGTNLSPHGFVTLSELDILDDISQWHVIGTWRGVDNRIFYYSASQHNRRPANDFFTDSNPFLTTRENGNWGRVPGDMYSDINRIFDTDDDIDFHELRLIPVSKLHETK